MLNLETGKSLALYFTGLFRRQEEKAPSILFKTSQFGAYQRIYAEENVRLLFSFHHSFTTRLPSVPSPDEKA